MTIQEMHIAVNLGVQKIASFQVDNLLPQEIDHELNDAMESFIKQRYSPMGNKYRKGFEQSQKRIDDLRNLVVTNRINSIFNGETITGFFVDRAPLPLDYMFLVSVLAETWYKCPGKLILGTDYKIEDFEIRYSTVNLFYQPGWKLIKIEGGGDSLIKDSISVQDIHNWVNSSTILGNFGIVTSNVSIPEITSPTFGSSEITPTGNSNQLTFYSDQASPGLIKLTWKNPITDDEVEIQSQFSAQEEYSKRVPFQSMLTKSRTYASYVQHDDLYSLLYDPFNTTSFDKVKYTIEENFVDVHNDNTFITTFVDIKYIRHPKQMDSGSGVGCELPEHTHQEIVGMAIQSILEALSDPRYNSQSREVLESE